MSEYIEIEIKNILLISQFKFIVYGNLCQRIKFSFFIENKPLFKLKANWTS